jgi:hypothetical protein
MAGDVSAKKASEARSVTACLVTKGPRGPRTSGTAKRCVAGRVECDAIAWPSPHKVRKSAQVRKFLPRDRTEWPRRPCLSFGNRDRPPRATGCNCAKLGEHPKARFVQPSTADRYSGRKLQAGSRCSLERFGLMLSRRASPTRAVERVSVVLLRCSCNRLPANNVCASSRLWKVVGKRDCGEGGSHESAAHQKDPPRATDF